MTTNSLVLHHKVLYAPKRGNEFYHYEDAFALHGVGSSDHSGYVHVGEKPTPTPDIKGRLRLTDDVWRCAVADGATEGGYSRLWAQMLTEYFIYQQVPLDKTLSEFPSWLAEMGSRWTAQKIPEILEMIPENSPKRYRVEQSLRVNGQASTMVMLELDPQAFRWKGAALGDALLFQIRGGDVLPNRPYSQLKWDELDTNPILISSRPDFQQQWIWNNNAFSPDEAFTQGSFEPSDIFMLMSDAMAKFFLRILQQRGASAEANQRYQNEVLALMKMSNNEFWVWLDERRSLPPDDPLYINNDDMTLVMLTVKPDTGGTPIQMIEPASPAPLDKPEPVQPAPTVDQSYAAVTQPAPSKPQEQPEQPPIPAGKSVSEHVEEVLSREGSSADNLQPIEPIASEYTQETIPSKPVKQEAGATASKPDKLPESRSNAARQDYDFLKPFNQDFEIPLPTKKDRYTTSIRRYWEEMIRPFLNQCVNEDISDEALRVIYFQKIPKKVSEELNQRDYIKFSKAARRTSKYLDQLIDACEQCFTFKVINREQLRSELYRIKAEFNEAKGKKKQP